MIITFTPNPSIDTTLELATLEVGGVHRTLSACREAGGKGINVTRACANAHHASMAIAPCGPTDPFALLCRTAGIQLKAVPISGTVRTNTALVERGGSTTKINETGPALSDTEVERITGVVLSTVAEIGPDAVVMAGSLPPGAPDDWYATLARQVRKACPGARIAIDTSDTALHALQKHLGDAKPDLMKPNAFELAQLTGSSATGHDLERDAARGDFTEVVAHASSLRTMGVREVVVTLGASGACLVTADGAWAATPPPVVPRSTVGAGDAALAGYMMARVAGLSPAECLRNSVAYGSAAAAKPGTGIPAPKELDLAHTQVFALPRS